MFQIPSLDWPRRTNPLSGVEDLLKQNPLTDSAPQEERIPVSLVSDFTINNITPFNAGTGIGVFHFKNGGDFQFRNINPLSNKLSVGLNGATIEMDVDALNVAAAISLTDISGISAPSAANQYLMWNGTGYEFNVLSPFGFILQDTLNQDIPVGNAATIKLNGVSPIRVFKNIGNPNQIDFRFNGGLDDLNDVTVTGAIPDGHALRYEASSGQWKPKPLSSISYSFNVRGDAATTSTVNNTDTLQISGNNTTISTTLVSANRVLINWQAQLHDLLNVRNSSPTNGQVLTFNTSINKWEAQTPSAGNYTATNGLSLAGSEFTLGGSLVQPVTTIDGVAFTKSIFIQNLSSFKVSSSKSFGTIEFDMNDTGGLALIKNRSTVSGNQGTYSFTSNSLAKYISIEANGTDNNKKFILKNTPTEGSLFFQSGETRLAGYIVEESKIKVLDGVNNPSAGHVLTYMADNTAQWRPLSGGTGGGDNWGTQAVVRNSTLTGDGTSSAPLGVTNPVPGGFTSGDYLGVSGTTIAWMKLPVSEIIGINEIARDSDVPVMVGRSFFVIPPQLSGWQIKSYAASVYTLGSGGDLTVRLNKNGVAIGTSSLTFNTKYATKSSVNDTVLAGDLLNIEVTGTKTTKDKGLTITLYLEP